MEGFSPQPAADEFAPTSILASGAGDYASGMGAGRKSALRGRSGFACTPAFPQSGRAFWKAAEDAGLQPGSVSKRRRSVSGERVRSKAERKNAGTSASSGQALRLGFSR